MNQQQIIADFRRRYEGTYVFVEFPNSAKEELFRVDSIEDSDATVGILCLSSDDYGKIRLNFATDHRILFKYPPIGVFQNGNQAYLFRRLPARQYARGICAGNSEIVPVTGLIKRHPNGLNFQTVKNAFIGKTYTFREAVAMLESKKFMSVALADGFSLSLSPTAQEGYLMFYFDIPVAWVNLKGELSIVLEETYNDQIKMVIGNGTSEIPF